jgi:tetratricopeptide (TPR) repeat protein
MSQLHLILEDTDEAEKYAQKAIAADPNSWRAHYFLGNVYAATDQQQKQIEHYDYALNALDEIIQNTPNSSDLQNLQIEREQIQNELEKLKK